ncbi:hypothetical protein [uncultured Sphaerochaeta sp.]|uniref:hypothetical protein n=1 Tax=uncultured Sphaerochaeta sp. TaxID=886478 RepID=UPI0029CA41D0|nr:hypothetical protein [uncultured Sphaerochaeta sp.]
MITKHTKLTNEDMLHRAEVRKAFNTGDGRAELTRILADLGMFREIKPEELPLRNYGIRKLEELGFLDIEVIVEVVNHMFSLPLALRPTVEETGEAYDDLL